jgi:hypothetical protein
MINTIRQSKEYDTWHEVTVFLIKDIEYHPTAALMYQEFSTADSQPAIR